MDIALNFSRTLENSQKGFDFPSAILRGGRHIGLMPHPQQKVLVSVAHRYANGLWSHERNQAVYGRDYSADGLGNNLEIAFEGEPADVDRVKNLIDHRCLFRDVARFQTEASTLERIALWLAEELGRPVTVTEADRVRCTAKVGDGRVEMALKIRNLWLGLNSTVDSESGLAVDRSEIEQLVNQVFKELSTLPSQEEDVWGQRLWESLAKDLKALIWVTVDLESQRTLRLARPTSGLG